MEIQWKKLFLSLQTTPYGCGSKYVNLFFCLYCSERTLTLWTNSSHSSCRFSCVLLAVTFNSCVCLAPPLMSLSGSFLRMLLAKRSSSGFTPVEVRGVDLYATTHLPFRSCIACPQLELFEFTLE